MNPQETVIVIRSLVPGGVAQNDGRLIPGDRVISVNDVNIEHASLDRAVQVLKGVPKGLVKITVLKPLSTNDSALHNSQVSVQFFNIFNFTLLLYFFFGTFEAPKEKNI